MTCQPKIQIPYSKTKLQKQGFTLIEVLLALAVIAIALTALLKATSQNVDTTRHIKEKTLSHWVAMQAVAMIQLNLIQLNSSVESTQVTSMFGQKWYWRAKFLPTEIKSVQEIHITVSTKDIGPFQEALIAFRYQP